MILGINTLDARGMSPIRFPPPPPLQAIIRSLTVYYRHPRLLTKKNVSIGPHTIGYLITCFPDFTSHVRSGANSRPPSPVTSGQRARCDTNVFL